MTKYYYYLISIVLLLSACNSDVVEHNLPINRYNISCDSVDFKSIHENFKSNTYIKGSLKNGEDLAEVKIRVRGDSSREYPKKSLKVKTLNKGKVRGKRVFNFNAEYKDQSFSHSYISSLLFKKINYPCFTSSMATVYVNDVFHGLFLEIENMDKAFLKANNLNPKGDLYKATKDGACLYTASEIDTKWEKKSNKKGSWSPLKNLIEEVSILPREEFESYIKANFDYEKLIDYLALNNFIANGSTNYHNYYLYKDIPNNGKWIFIPWDLDKTLSYYSWKPFDYHSTSSDWENDNPIIEGCYLNKSIREDVKTRLRSFETLLGADFYEPILESIEVKLKEIVLEDETDKVKSEKSWQKAIRTERKFFKNRSEKAIQKMEEFPLSFEVHKTAPLLSTPFYLSWDKAKDSTDVSYEVYLSKDFLYRDTLLTRVFETTESFIKVEEELPLGTYFWKVVAVKGKLKSTGFNSKNSFELRKGTLLPTNIDSSQVLTAEQSPYRVTDSLIIRKNAVLNSEPGVVILTGKNAKIKVFGGLNFKGTQADKINIQPELPSSYFHSIFFYSSAFSNVLEHTNIQDGLVNSKYSDVSIKNSQIDITNRPMQFGTKRPSIIWAWHGSIFIDGLQLNGNGKGEGININWADAYVRNSKFYNTPDAIEFINVSKGEIANNLVLQSPDDAIDLNACKDLTIQNNVLVNSADKGISIGAEQYGKSRNISLSNNYLIGNKIGLSVKDSADVYSNTNVYAHNKLAIESYRKNPSYALGGYIQSENDEFTGNVNLQKIDDLSSLEINNARHSNTQYKNGNDLRIPQLLSYSGTKGILVLKNNSPLDIDLSNCKLIVDTVVNIELNTVGEIKAGSSVSIFKAKPEDRKHQNYFIYKPYEVNRHSEVYLSVDEEKFILKYIGI